MRMNRDGIRAVAAAASAVRLSYALGPLLAPERMSRLRLAAATPGNGMASMTTRAFGAMHANLALLTLLAALRDQHLRRCSNGVPVGCEPSWPWPTRSSSRRA